MNRLDRIGDYNINKNKDKSNDTIDNDPRFDNKFFNLSRGTKDPLPVVIVGLLVCKKHIATTVAGLT